MGGSGGTATEQRDLRTGAPVWELYPILRAEGARLSRSRKADVVIVGAGITGALIAEAATSLGQSTIVLDRRLPAKGSTAASTALLQFEIDTPLLHLVDMIGFERASRAWLRSFEAVQGLQSLVGRLSIPCAFRVRQALYLAGNTLGAEDILKEGELRQSIGLPSQHLDRMQLLVQTGIKGDAALISTGAADINPVGLTHGLLRIAVARGAALHAPVDLVEVAPVGDHVMLATSAGVEIQTKSLIFATGYELAKGVPHKGHKRTSTWAFATRPQPEALRSAGDMVIWEAAEPYLYVRSTADGRLVVGGEDEDLDDATKRDALIPEKIVALQRKTAALLPWVDNVAELSWAGTFGESETGLPSIGPVPGMPGCYAALGYGGNGITFGYLAATLLRAYLAGQVDTDATLFAFQT